MPTLAFSSHDKRSSTWDGGQPCQHPAKSEQKFSDAVALSKLNESQWERAQRAALCENRSMRGTTC
jgi:hypothetical protein